MGSCRAPLASLSGIPGFLQSRAGAHTLENHEIYAAKTEPARAEEAIASAGKEENRVSAISLSSRFRMADRLISTSEAHAGQ